MMDDISAFIKSSSLNLQKKAIGKNYQQKTLRDRMNIFKNIRRETRNTLMFQKRQISENMSPINTPEPSKIVKKAVEKKEEKKSSKRLEMLNKWKAEKEIQKQEEKRKAKPLFKVYHVPVEVGLPKLENVNKIIKGKPISQFAPPNHSFHAPKNVQPINFGDKNNSLLTKSKLRRPKINLVETSKSTPRPKLTGAQKNTKDTTHKKEVVGPVKLPENQINPQIPKVKFDVKKGNPRSTSAKIPTAVYSKIESKTVALQKSDQLKENTLNSRKKSGPKTKLVAKAKSSVSAKCSPPKKNRKSGKNNVKTDVSSEALEYVTSISSMDDETRSCENNTPVTTVKRMPKRNTRAKQIREDLKNQEEIKVNSVRTPKKYTKSTTVSFKKNVDWNVVEIVDSDDEVSAITINSRMSEKTPKKYNKTPKRNKKLETVGDVDIDETKCNEDEEVQRNSQYTPKNNNKPEDVYTSPLVTVAAIPGTTVKRTSKGKTGTKKIKDGDDVKNKEELKENLVDTPHKYKSPTVTPKKNVGWNVIEVVDSDDEVLAKNITPKKYNKTQKKLSEKPETAGDVDTETKRKEDEAVEINSQSTPKNNKKPDDTSPVYISPFVTISRGKTSARKEYKVRQSGSDCTTPDFNKSVSDSISPKAGAEYFTKKLNNEITRIESICDTWNTYRDENDVPEEANDLIDVAIGQSKLLVAKKFKQFRDLIEQCRNSDYLEKPVSCEDLHGFWDMMYMQVEDLIKRFKNLDDLKANNWQEVIPVKKPVVKRGRGRPKKAAASAGLKDVIKAARKNKKGSEEENHLIVPQSDEVKLFSGGYYLIKSPVKEGIIPSQRPSSTRRSLRVSLLMNQVTKRFSSPGLTMMKVSQAIKHGDCLTPGRSILKNDLTKSDSRKAKSVLFKDNLEKTIDEDLYSLKANVDNYADKENEINEINLITFSPLTPRRSQRVTRIK